MRERGRRRRKFVRCGAGCSNKRSGNRLIMSKPTSKRPPSDRRPVRRSLVELTAVASRAVDDGLSVAAPGLTAAAIERTAQCEPAAERPLGITVATPEAPVAEPEGNKSQT